MTETRRNPFRVPEYAKLFDGLLAAYAAGHRDILRDGRRALGNSLASAFWRGYDSVPNRMFAPGTFGFVAYRTGQAQRLADNERGVYIAA
jgi:hypothetical protein